MADGSRRLRWGNFYPLLHVSEPLQPEQLPPPRELVGLDDLGEAPRVLVIGERGGGGGDFLRWWQAGLSERSRRWVYARGNRWLPEFFEASDGGDPLTQAGVSLLGELTRGNEQQRAQRIMAWAKALYAQGESAHLLLRDLGALGERSAKQLAEALQLACEKVAAFGALRVVVVSSSEDRFADFFYATGFASRSQRFRMAWLTADDVAYLADHGTTEPLTIAPEGVSELLEVSGGQPRLVWTILDALRATRRGQAVPGLRDLDQVYRKLRASPPAFTGDWRRDLDRRLKQTPALGKLLRQFVGDQNLGPEQSHTTGVLPLMHAGWVRFDEIMKQWRISSRLHAHLAQQVLAELGL